MFDSAPSEAALTISCYVRGGVPRSDLLIELLQGVPRLPGGPPTGLGSAIADTFRALLRVVRRFPEPRTAGIGRQTKEVRDFTCSTPVTTRGGHPFFRRAV